MLAYVDFYVKMAQNFVPGITLRTWMNSWLRLGTSVFDPMTKSTI
jgi:hypothetical protein